MAVESRVGRPLVATIDELDSAGCVTFRDEYDTLVGFWRPNADYRGRAPVFVIACLGCQIRGPAPHMTANGLIVGRANNARAALLAVEFGLGVVALGLEQRLADATEWQGTCDGRFLSVRESAKRPGDGGRRWGRWIAELDCNGVGRGRTWYEAARLLAAEVFP